MNVAIEVWVCSQRLHCRNLKIIYCGNEPKLGCFTQFVLPIGVFTAYPFNLILPCETPAGQLIKMHVSPAFGNTGLCVRFP